MFDNNFRINSIQIEDGKFVVENLNKVVGGTDGGSVGGKMAKQFIDEVTNDCKDIHNDDKYKLYTTWFIKT